VRRIYVMPLVLFALGLGLVMYSTSGGSSVSIFGFDVVIQVVRGVGLIAIIASAIAFLAAYGSTIPPRQHGASPPTGDTHGKSENLAGR
jgi:hypothetical protein